MSAASDDTGIGTPRLLRAINERALLDHLRQAGPRSRAQLARDTGLSKPTVSQALANLERVGLVRHVGHAAGPRGRAALVYEPDASAGHVVGIDVGRVWLRAAAADLSGTVLARTDERNRARSAASLVRAVAALHADVAAKASLSAAAVTHTVVGTPGVVDRASGRLVYAMNLPGWGRPGLLAALNTALGEPTTVENDVNLAALGEREFGAGAQARTFVFLSVGTGVGMGLVLDGELFRGARGAAGEVGFLPFGPGGAARTRGSLEAAASADGVVELARELGMAPPLSAKRVFEAAAAGDATALRVVAGEAQRLALVVATAAAMIDPELVVLGGGVGRNLELLRAPLLAHLEELTPLRPEVVTSRLGDDAVVLGAIATGVEIARDTVFRDRAGDGRVAAV